MRKKITQGPALPGKLADCTSQRSRRAPSCSWSKATRPAARRKQARDKDFQAILPLRGKILNTWEVESGSVLASQEVHDLAVAIGCDPGKDDLTGLRYGKVCILADADSDGLHIATLLSRAVPAALPGAGARRPRVRRDAAAVPRRRRQAGVLCARRRRDATALLERIEREKIKGAVNVTRFKGLGEMNPLQLRETTIHPDTRRLVQLTVDDDDGTSKLMDMLLAKKRAGDRKEWLETKGDLATLEV